VFGWINHLFIEMGFSLRRRPRQGPAAATSLATSVSLHLYCSTHWTDSYSAPSASSRPQAFRARVGGQSLTLSTRPARRIAALPCRTKIYGCKPLTFFSAVSWLHSTQMYPAQGLMIDSELRFTNCHATRNATSKAPFIVWLSDCSMVGIFYLLVIIFGPLFFRLRWKSLGRICFFLGKKYCHKKVYCFSCLLNCDLNYFGYTPQHLPMSHDSSYILILMNWDGHKITMGVSILLHRGSCLLGKHHTNNLKFFHILVHGIACACYNLGKQMCAV
jgi:hypothetical protein